MNSNESITSGFYHDVQKSNKLLRVSLHANSKYTGEGDNGWEYNSGEKYDEEPLVVSIVRDDFQIGVSNSWGEFSMGESITNLFNQAKPFAPYLNEISKEVEKMSSTGRQMQSNNTIEGILTDAILDGLDKMKPFIDKGSDYLSRALVTQGTRFSYYSGTGVAFGNLGMKFTVFADWKDSNFLTVDDQLSKLYPYLIGKYKDAQTKSKLINRFFGWQIPPGGFNANTKDINSIQKGTLMLKIGSYYCINNLVIKDIQLNFSKYMVKEPDSTISPLYCEVDLVLSPVCKYTDEDLKRFVSGIEMNKEKTEAEEEMSSNLSKEKSRLQELIDKYNK